MKSNPTPQRIVLASSSIYRRQLLAKLQIKFQSASPDIDEKIFDLSRPDLQSQRLALRKAEALKDRFGNHLIIGSDQIAILNNRQLDKPMVLEIAIKQLLEASGKAIEFYTAVCIFDSATGHHEKCNELTTVYLKKLSRQRIIRYLERERPFDCAASLKIETSAISLVDKIDCEDPTALIGLPLIKLCSLLEKFDVVLP